MEGKTTSEGYWTNLYSNKQTGWDIGFPAPALKEYIDQLQDTSTRILIPGCGNAYEAAYLLAKGFSNVTLIDIVPSVTAELGKKLQDFGTRIRIIAGDFFEHQGKYDLILEQTFLSALDPSLRTQYVDQMHALLAKDGHLTGVLFGKVFEEDGPPYGATPDTYWEMFSKKFRIKTLQSCYNSIERRAGSEVFINLVAK